MTGNIWCTAKTRNSLCSIKDCGPLVSYMHNVVKWLFRESDGSAAHYLGMLVLYPLSTRQALQ